MCHIVFLLLPCSYISNCARNAANLDKSKDTYADHLRQYREWTRKYKDIAKHGKGPVPPDDPLFGTQKHRVCIRHSTVHSPE